MLTATLVLGARQIGIIDEAFWILSRSFASKPVVAITMLDRRSRHRSKARMHPSGLEKSIAQSKASGQRSPMAKPMGSIPEKLPASCPRALDPLRTEGQESLAVSA